MNYFELYPGDYLRDTTRLTLLEHGAYMRLLMTYYGEEEPLPSAFSELFVIVGAVDLAGRNAVKKVAEKFFPLGEDGMRHNARADEEIAKAQERMGDQGSERKTGQAARAKRYRDRRSAMFELLREHGVVLDFNTKAEDLEAAVMALARDGKRDARRDGTRDERDDVHRDITASRPQTPDISRAGSRALVRTSRFDEFWNLYPTKKGKAKARISFDRLKPDQVDALFAALPEQIAHDRQFVEGFAPHPTTYLNGQRWTDEIEPVGNRHARPGKPTLANRLSAELEDIQRTKKRDGVAGLAPPDDDEGAVAVYGASLFGEMGKHGR